MAEELHEVTSIGELWPAAPARVADHLRDSSRAEQHRTLRAERDPQRLEVAEDVLRRAEATLDADDELLPTARVALRDLRPLPRELSDAEVRR